MSIILLSAPVPDWTREQLKALGEQLPPEAGKSAGSVASWLLLARGLADYYGILTWPEVTKPRSGKPIFSKLPQIQFSLSHSQSRAVCAIHSLPVGCDIEPENRKIPAILLEKTTTDQEKSLIEASQNPDELFLRLWTLKEASLKRDGSGLAGGIRTRDMAQAVQTGREGESWCTTLTHQGHIISTCGADKPEKVAEIQL